MERQPFVWSNGDNSGAGFHGDFVSGWIPEILSAAIAHPNCSNNNPLMNFGNSVQNCPPLRPYVKTIGADPTCTLLKPMPTTENLGLSNPISKLPGCNPISAGPANAVKCGANLSASDNAGIFTLQSVALGTYITADKVSRVMYSNYSAAITLQEMWGFNIYAAGHNGAPTGYIVLQNQEDAGVASAQSSATLKDQIGTWEFWKPVYSQYTAPGSNTPISVVAFQSLRNNLYMTVNTAGNLVGFNAATVNATELFVMTASNGGYVALQDGFDSIAGQTVFTVPTYTPANPAPGVTPATVGQVNANPLSPGATIGAATRTQIVFVLIASVLLLLL